MLVYRCFFYSIWLNISFNLKLDQRVLSFLDQCFFCLLDLPKAYAGLVQSPEDSQLRFFLFHFIKNQLKIVYTSFEITQLLSIILFSASVILIFGKTVVLFYVTLLTKIWKQHATSLPMYHSIRSCNSAIQFFTKRYYMYTQVFLSKNCLTCINS